MVDSVNRPIPVAGQRIRSDYRNREFRECPHKMRGQRVT